MEKNIRSCENCEHYYKNTNKEPLCDLAPSELTSIICLLRHICWTLNLSYMIEQEDREDGDWWKYGDKPF